MQSWNFVSREPAQMRREGKGKASEAEPVQRLRRDLVSLSELRDPWARYSRSRQTDSRQTLKQWVQDGNDGSMGESSCFTSVRTSVQMA